MAVRGAPGRNHLGMSLRLPQVAWMVRCHTTVHRLPRSPALYRNGDLPRRVTREALRIQRSACTTLSSRASCIERRTGPSRAGENGIATLRAPAARRAVHPFIPDLVIRLVAVATRGHLRSTPPTGSSWLLRSISTKTTTTDHGRSTPSTTSLSCELPELRDFAVSR
jgi:hypothetical protein